MNGAVPITSRVERAQGRARREALNVILPRLSALQRHAVETNYCATHKVCEIRHAGLTLWFTWFPEGLNVVVYNGELTRDGPGFVTPLPPRAFSCTFDPNNLATAKPMGWKRGDWEARIFKPVVRAKGLLIDAVDLLAISEAIHVSGDFSAVSTNALKMFAESFAEGHETRVVSAELVRRGEL